MPLVLPNHNLRVYTNKDNQIRLVLKSAHSSNAESTLIKDAETEFEISDIVKIAEYLNRVITTNAAIQISREQWDKL